MLSVELKPAWRLAILLFFMHFGAMVCLLPLQLFWPIKIILLLTCLVGLSLALRRYVWLCSAKSILKITQLENGGWRLHNHAGEEIHANLHGSSVQTPYFMLLNFSCMDSSRYYKVIVISNSSLRDDFRRLQIVLFH